MAKHHSTTCHLLFFSNLFIHLDQFDASYFNENTGPDFFLLDRGICTKAYPIHYYFIAFKSSLCVVDYKKIPIKCSFQMS